jgi:hypothetical protein
MIRASREQGSAVVMFIILLGIMLALVAANGKTLVVLKKDLQLIERRQIQRLERSQTNASTPVTIESRTAPATP